MIKKISALATVALLLVVAYGVKQSKFSGSGVKSKTETPSLLNANVVTTNALIQGESKKWHKMTFTFDGPSSSENSSPNPFLNYRFDLLFTSPSGAQYRVPGFFAADGNAANTSSVSGNKWRCNFNPNETGTWSYVVFMRTGTNVSIAANPLSGTPVGPDGQTGTFVVADTDKTDKGFRTRGRLEYKGEHYEIYGETGKAFIKAGPGSPENFLAYNDFDQTYSAGGFHNFIHSYSPHSSDWRSGDPSWKGSNGREIIGALNYIASKDCNAIYFMVHNRSRSGNGDGQDTWPWSDKNERQRFDISKLAQWEIVFDHASNLGIRLNMFLQEVEIQNDMGDLDTERKLFFREMVARFGHVGGVQWNLGEENTQSHSTKKAQADFIRSIDPYRHPIAYHTNFDDEDDYYGVYGHPNFESSSFQGNGGRYDSVATEIRNSSASSGRRWIAYGDEQSPDDLDNESEMTRIFGRNVFSGGGGCEYYAGNPETGGGSDLTLENFRDYDQLWSRIGKMRTFIEDNIDVRTTIPNSSQRKLSNSNDQMIYLQNGGSTSTSLAPNDYIVSWLNVDTGQVSVGNSTPLSGNVNLNSPFGGSQAIVSVKADISVDDAMILSSSFPEKIMSQNPTNVSITVKNTGNTTWERGLEGYTLSVENDNCEVFLDNISLENGEVVNPGETYVFNILINYEIPFEGNCNARFQMRNWSRDKFGDFIDVNFQIGNELSVDFSNNTMGWEDFTIMGNSTTHSGANGLCMWVPEQGVNISGWASPVGYIELVDQTIYKITLELSTDQTNLNAIPLFDLAIDNWNGPQGRGGNIYAGEYFILDVGPPGIGGANGIGRPNGRSSFDVYFAPNAMLTPQWAGVFDPSFDDINDMRLIVRLLDLGNAGINADIDSGTVCVNKIIVTRIPSSVLDSTEILFDEIITTGSFVPFSHNQNPKFAEIDNDTNTANYILDNNVDQANFFPGSEPFGLDSLFPIEWESNTLYVSRVDIQLAEESTGFDPIDGLSIIFDTAVFELAQINSSTRGSANNMEYASSPWKSSDMGTQTFIGLFYGNNVTNINLENANRLRSYVSLFNSPDLFGSGTGNDMTQITRYTLEKVNLNN